MSGKTLIEVRDLAKGIAERRGHKIRRWNRSRHHYTAICEKCRANLKVFSQAQNNPGLQERLDPAGNFLIARDRDQFWTELDYNIAEGSALRERCYLS